MREARRYSSATPRPTCQTRLLPSPEIVKGFVDPHTAPRITISGFFERFEFIAREDPEARVANEITDRDRGSQDFFAEIEFADLGPEPGVHLAEGVEGVGVVCYVIEDVVL